MAVKGLVDDRVVDKLSKRYPLDVVYIDFLSHLDSARVNKTVKVAEEKIPLELYLTLYDKNTELEDESAHFDIDFDERIVEGVYFLTYYEHATSRHLFDGLVPFASVRCGMCLDRSYVNLFCFDFRPQAQSHIVLWKGHEAGDAYFDWERLCDAGKIDEDDEFKDVDWDSFLMPVADSFTEFLGLIEEVE